MLDEPQCPSPKCDRPAGYGTDHVGMGYCFRHGGQFPNMIRNVANQELSALVGEPVDVEPSRALLWCVSLAAQDLHWINLQIANLDKATQRPVTQETGYTEKGGINKKTYGPREVHGYITMRFAAEERLARFSKMALDAGVNERMIALAESMGEMIAPLLRNVLDALGLTPDQLERAPKVIEGEIRRMEQSPLMGKPQVLA